MASLLTSGQKAAMQAVMTNIHDTFKLPLKLFKEGKETVISTNPNYSHVYKQPNLSNIQKTEMSKDIEARIYFLPRQLQNEDVSITTQDSLKLQQPNEECRLKLAVADYEFVKDTERFIINGVPYEKKSDPIPTGLFGSGFYTLYLKRVS